MLAFYSAIVSQRLWSAQCSLYQHICESEFLLQLMNKESLKNRGALEQFSLRIQTFEEPLGVAGVRQGRRTMRGCPNAWLSEVDRLSDVALQ